MKILVVDDAQINLLIAKDLLELQVDNEGVLLCKNPEKVMGILETEDVGIILLDIIMPKLDGITLLKMIRDKEEYKDIQVIMFTGVSDKESFRRCFEQGANDYINKPIDQTEFIVRMQAAAKARKNLLELRKTRAYILQTEKLASLGELAAGIAHEINNPIGFVGSNLETMAKYLDKVGIIITEYRKLGRLIQNSEISREEMAVAWQQIAGIEKLHRLDHILADFTPIIGESRDGIARVSKIVQSLRNFARIDQADEVTPVDMNQIVEEALLIMNNEVKYVATVEKSLRAELEVECNKGQVVQVMINILHNAAQAIKGQNRSEFGIIRIDTYEEEQFAVCRIADNGPGIRNDHVNRIFDPFFTTKEVGSGTGLGLSISYGIIAKFAGELLVESDWGAGATFFVKLPLVKRS